MAESRFGQPGPVHHAPSRSLCRSAGTSPHSPGSPCVRSTAVAPQISPQLCPSRTLATAPPPPAERAAELIDKLPSSPNLITKTGTALLGSGLLAAAISHELYVVNEETVVAVGSLIFFTYLAKVCPILASLLTPRPSLPVSHPQILREPYRDWADGHINRIKSVLQSARAEHTQAVKDRISSVENMKNVTDLTKALFALSKVAGRRIFLVVVVADNSWATGNRSP